MRNLIEYPVTKDELLQWIDARVMAETIVQEQTMRCGDMTLTYLDIVRKLVEREWNPKYGEIEMPQIGQKDY